MASTTKLIVWNAALRELGGAALANTSDVNTRQFELAGAWDHAVEHALALEDWGFARRRSSLSGVSDTSYPPYTYRFAKPSDFLRKCWLKTNADEEYQVDHAEVAAVFYAQVTSGLLEYVSDDAANYDPANWPPHFTRVVTLSLASLVAPKLARAGSGEVGMLDGKMQATLDEAKSKEALFLTNGQLPVARQPVFRRAIEFLGQELAGSVAIHAQADKLRWAMNRAWPHAVKYVLEMGAWNFATRRATLTGGTELVPGGVESDIIEGYVVAPATEPEAAADLPDMAGFDYGFALPVNFLHKIWIKPDASSTFECSHQFMGSAVYTNVMPVVLEYIANDDDAMNPANWSANFLEAVAAYLALMVTPELVIEQGRKSARITANDLRGKLESVFLAKLSDAKMRDAMQQEPKALPPGRFVRARMGASLSRHS